MNLGGQSKAKLQFCGSHLAVEELWESHIMEVYGKTIAGLGPDKFNWTVGISVCVVHFVFADITLVSQKYIYSLVYIVDIKPVVLAHVS